jgi:hypothetical protein
MATSATSSRIWIAHSQGLAAQASIDPKTQKLVLPAGCAEALRKYLDLEPTGQYAASARDMPAAGGVAVKPATK